LIGTLKFSFGNFNLTSIPALFLLLITSVIYSYLFDHFWKKVK
jgi:hypothetical protein